MTTCSTFANSIKKRVEEGKDLDTIAGELCSDVKFNRQKVIRVIKDFLGDEYLSKHAETLGYDIEKAKLGNMQKQPKLGKIKAEADSEPLKPSYKVDKISKEKLPEPEYSIKILVEKYGFDNVKTALNEVEL